MPGWGVIPSIRVRDLSVALSFYREKLGFVLERPDTGSGNCSLSRGDARVMLEVPGGFYSPRYNEAIRQRAGTASAMALYIEATDLADLCARVQAAGLPVVDPLADRPWGQSEFTVADLQGNWLTFWKALAEG